MRSHLEWCRKQRRGLKLATPEKELAEAFVKKAKNALIMLKCAKDKDLPDWIATTPYYAKYFALYALFVKCGIKCEIHDCTILAMKELFVDTGMLDKGLHHDISNSKGLRVDMQYYTYNKPYRSRAIESADSASEFVSALTSLSERLTHEHIASIRSSLRNLSRDVISP